MAKRRSFTREEKEVRYSGKAACLAILKERPEEILRLFCAETLVPMLGDALKALAKAGKVYRIVPPGELDRIAASTHHQGIVVVTKPKRELAWLEFLNRVRKENPELLLCLAGVENPHNFGAILRSAAHFGVPFVIGDRDAMPRLSAAAARIAEGGGEFVDIVRASPLDRGLGELKKLGYKIYLMEQVPRAIKLHELNFPEKSVVVMGNEVRGIPRELARVANASVEIAGSGKVDSLNVSVAAAVVLAAHDVQRRRKST